MQPFVQGQLEHSRAHEARQDAHALIDAISDYDITGGLRLSFTGYTTFTQTGGPERTEVEISVGTPSKPSKRTVTKYVFKGVSTQISAQITKSGHTFTAVIAAGNW